MKKRIAFGITAISLAIMLVVVGVTSGFTSQYNESDQEAFEAAISADSTVLQTGVIPIERIQSQVMMTNANGTDQTQESLILERASEIQGVPDYEKYFSSDRAEQLTESHEAAIQNLNDEEVTVGGGKLDNQLISSEEVSSTEKIIGVNGVSWLETIYYRNSKYVVNLIFSRDTISYRMVNENGTWKVAETLAHQMEFAPDDYQGDKGTFDTFQEAVDFAAQLDVTAENPF